MPAAAAPSINEVGDMANEEIVRFGMEINAGTGVVGVGTADKYCIVPISRVLGRLKSSEGLDGSVGVDGSPGFEGSGGLVGSDGFDGSTGLAGFD